ncbi:hypothetical protein M0R04_15155 [Candidatus Dojkabacteria bacterium]|jgi:hypothetical protein|nr:hypothetical protein [Candidatus Dojkabacteria bacterium]
MMKKEKNDTERGTLGLSEPHPAAYEAIKYLRSLDFKEIATFSESFASCSLSGNRLSEVCSETLRRFMTGEPVSDRYILGLAWTIRTIKEHEDGQGEA